MEILVAIIVIILLILVIGKISGMKDELNQLRRELFDVRRFLETKFIHREELPPVKKAVVQPEPIKPEPPIEKIEIKERPVPKPETAPSKIEPVKARVPEPVLAKQTEPRIQKPGGSWFERFLQENPDIEKFIGENLINKIGIAVLVLGIAFFVKYAIDQEWINKVGRVCVGLLCGVILTGLAHRLRKNYHAFSSVLAGGGIAIFYFTIAFAFHQYQLFGQEVAFGIMVVITIFAVLLSVLYDRIELGILATIGGFIAPFLVSKGDGNWLVLFTYLSILNTGLIFLAYYKRWRVINFIAFLFTEIIYLGWIIDKGNTTGFSYQGIFIFGAVFYLMFIVMNVIHHVIRASKLTAFDFLILLSVNLSFYGAGMYLIQESGAEQFKGLFTAALGIINLILAFLFYKQSKADKKFIFLLIGITVSFISMAAPVQLNGHYITLFWSAEMVVLLWLYQRSFIPLLKVAVLLVTFLMLFSLVFDWSAIYVNNESFNPILFNKGWVTAVFSAISLNLVFRLLQKEADTFFCLGISNKFLRDFYLVSSILLLYAAGAFEIGDQFYKRCPGSGLQFVYLVLYSTAFVLALLFVLNRFKINVNHKLPVVLAFLVFGMYLAAIRTTNFTEGFVLSKDVYKMAFALSRLGVPLLLLLVWNTIMHIRKNQESFAAARTTLTWIISVFCITFFSTEIRNLFIWINYSGAGSLIHDEVLFDKAGLTIVWAISSFVMIWLGMKYSYKPLRVAALAVFAIALLKLFMFDIRNIAPGGKILAFILLGVLLLIISFMYQRLKKIIIDDANDLK